MFKWLGGGKVAEVGVALADTLALHAVSGPDGGGSTARLAPNPGLQKYLPRFLQQVDRETGALKLNILSRAKLANSFKWRLLEKGIDRGLVDELTQSLVLRLTVRVPDAVQADGPSTAKKGRLNRDVLQALLNEGNGYLARGECDRALDCFEQALQSDPRNLTTLNLVGNTLCRLGRYSEGAARFRQAINIKETHPDAHWHLGGLLLSQGYLADSEQHLRRALKLKPTLVGAQTTLGATLFMLNKNQEARALLEKVLRVEPRNLDGLMHMGKLAAQEGNREEAEALYRRAIEVDARAWLAWIGIGELRRSGTADPEWLKGIQALVGSSALNPLNEASVHTAIGKYYDQLGEYAKAFKSYQRAKELIKISGASYDRGGAERNTEILVRTYPREVFAGTRPGASTSDVPVIVTGMPRSGTSLVEQILASHPAIGGAGELNFWANAVAKRPASLALAPPDEATSQQLAAAYLRVLTAGSAGASRVVDKSIYNFLYLGVIHAIFPRARLIYLRRDPIDTCLSCFFQDFAPAVSFAHDLGDLAHIYREHHKIITHWHSVLPPGTLLEVPYEELTADQEGWTRRIVEFVGVPWDDRCLQFHDTKRSVATASQWQVRQKMYQTSVGRWRHYEKFIGPLLELRDLKG